MHKYKKKQTLKYNGNILEREISNFLENYDIIKKKVILKKNHFWAKLFRELNIIEQLKVNLNWFVICVVKEIT